MMRYLRFVSTPSAAWARGAAALVAASCLVESARAQPNASTPSFGAQPGVERALSGQPLAETPLARPAPTDGAIPFQPAAAPRAGAESNSASVTNGAAENSGAAQKPGGLVETVAIPTKNLLQVLRDGGPLMLPIGVCSFILLVFVFERMVSLRRGRVIPAPFVRRFLGQIREGRLDRDAAIALCDQNRSPVAEVFSAALKKWGRPSVEVEQAILDAGERVSNRLRRYLRLLNGVSTVTPLLGLLGTVLGMIQSFNVIAAAEAMGRPDLLAGGISEALLTTAAGLTVAIPALIAYLYFVGRVDRLIMDIDALGQDLVSLISADGWERQKAAEKAAERAAEKAAERDKAAADGEDKPGGGGKTKRRAQAA